MGRGKKLAELSLVDLPNKEGMVKRLNGIDKNIREIRQLARLYGLPVDAPDPTPDVEVKEKT
jgi:hypothetical protein